MKDYTAIDYVRDELAAYGRRVKLEVSRGISKRLYEVSGHLCWKKQKLLAVETFASERSDNPNTIAYDSNDAELEIIVSQTRDIFEVPRIKGF